MQSNFNCLPREILWIKIKTRRFVIPVMIVGGLALFRFFEKKGL
jgi:hypothetical protein